MRLISHLGLLIMEMDGGMNSASFWLKNEKCQTIEGEKKEWFKSGSIIGRLTVAVKILAHLRTDYCARKPMMVEIENNLN